MSHPYYHRCCSCLGKCVLIRTQDGRALHGRVNRVTYDHVYLSPIARGIDYEANQLQVHKSTALTAVGVDKAELGEEIFFGPFIVPLAAIVGLTIVGTAPFWGRGFFW